LFATVFLGYPIWNQLTSAAVTVSPSRVPVASDTWSGIFDVSVTNIRDQPWYDADFIISPSHAAAIEFTAEPIGGGGSSVGMFAVDFADRSQTWALPMIAPKATVVYRIKSRLKRRGASEYLQFRTLPGGAEPRGPRVGVHE
jgi:hypothetical protein